MSWATAEADAVPVHVRGGRAPRTHWNGYLNRTGLPPPYYRVRVQALRQAASTQTAPVIG
jgi:hypothetical protein